MIDDAIYFLYQLFIGCTKLILNYCEVIYLKYSSNANKLIGNHSFYFLQYTLFQREI